MMHTSLILLSLAGCINNAAPAQALFPHMVTNGQGVTNCIAKRVIMVIDIVHFYDYELDCGYGICVCKEARLSCDCSLSGLAVSLNKREVFCMGTIEGNRLKLNIPSDIKRVPYGEADFSVHESINIVNDEREIIYKILPGNYLIKEEKDGAFVFLNLQEN